MSFVDAIQEVVEDLIERWLGERHFGIAYAEVSALADEGCQVTYRSLNLDQASPVARIASAMAGAGRGAFFRPEVGDVVIVAFENGLLSQPVILGGVWTSDRDPPNNADRSEANNIRTIVSREGHEVTFDDTPGQSQVLIRTKSGAKIVLDEGTKQVRIDTTGRISDSGIVLDGVSWNHQHATGVGPSGPPVSISPPPPAAGSN